MADYMTGFGGWNFGPATPLQESARQVGISRYMLVDSYLDEQGEADRFPGAVQEYSGHVGALIVRSTLERLRIEVAQEERDEPIVPGVMAVKAVATTLANEQIQRQLTADDIAGYDYREARRQQGQPLRWWRRVPSEHRPSVSLARATARQLREDPTASSPAELVEAQVGRVFDVEGASSWPAVSVGQIEEVADAIIGGQARSERLIVATYALPPPENYGSPTAT